MKKLLLVLVFILFAQGTKSFAQDNPVALTIAGEAGGEGYRGMYAVACVIQNRAIRTHKDPKEVVMAGFYGRTSKMARRSYIAHQAAILKLVNLLEKGLLKDITGGATHFDNVELFGYPKWTKRMTKTCKIGHHTFFKEEK